MFLLPGSRALKRFIPSVIQQNSVQKNIGLFPILRGYIGGLTLSTAGASSTFSVTAGVAVDSTNTDVLTLNSVFSKTTAAWAVGSGNGGWDGGGADPSTTAAWYSIYLIKRPDSGRVDVIFSQNGTPTTLTNIPNGYRLLRRIGSIKTNASNQWVKFFQDGDYFEWDVPVSDVSAVNPGKAAVTRTLTVPLGNRVRAHIAGGASFSDTGPGGMFFSDLSTTDTAASATASTINALSTGGATTNAVHSLFAWTNTSGQIRTRQQISTASITLIIITQGWMDYRGSTS